MPCQITYTALKRTRPIEPGGTLLAAFKTHGVPVAYSCENAECGTCVVRLNSGNACLSAVEAGEDATLRDQGYPGEADPTWRLACQARIVSNGSLEVQHKPPR